MDLFCRDLYDFVMDLFYGDSFLRGNKSGDRFNSLQSSLLIHLQKHRPFNESQYQHSISFSPAIDVHSTDIGGQCPYPPDPFKVDCGIIFDSDALANDTESSLAETAGTGYEGSRLGMGGWENEKVGYGSEICYDGLFRMESGMK